MWLLVILFIVLQPGLFITIPPVGKKLFASGKKSWASILVHALIFVVLARYVFVVSEGFQPTPPATSPCAATEYVVWGSYNATYNSWSSSCYTCPAGYYCNGSTSVATSCPLGYFCNN